MNKKTKILLGIIILFQILLLVVPVSARLTDKSPDEKEAEETGKEFCFVASSVSVKDGRLLLAAYVRNTIDGGNVAKNEKLELYVDENGEISAKDSDVEKDWYTDGDYFTGGIPLENVVFSEGWDIERVRSIVEYRQNKAQWHFNENYEYDESSFYEAEFNATVYRDKIVIHTLYIDGEEVLRAVE